MRFDFSDIPSLDGKVAIVTGASSGIGLVTARELAKKHCHVILACRSKAKTEPVIKAIQETAPNANVEFMELDLASLKAVQAFTDAYKARGLPLHLLVNNAGIADGFDWDKINNPHGYYAWAAYSQSKLANVLFTRELCCRLHARGIQNVYVNTLHPASVFTGVIDGFPWVVRFLAKFVLYNAEDGAKTQLYVATHEDIVTNNWHGQYFVPIAELSETNALGQDMDLASRLWDFFLDFINKIIQG
ncbi:hypothetical protein AC1031_000687 [Aphanomyces cochlioides]|nr:hypothetical protein AC1031_000687 [Aphanomyces cochlioides]